MSSNIVYINHEKLENVIISADSVGNNNIPNFNRQKTFHPNNTWWVNDKIVCDAIIITDDVGKNTFKLELPREPEPEEKNIFRELLLTVHETSQSKQTDINSYLMKKRINFIDKLKAATDAYHAKSYWKSCGIFIECLQIYDADEYPDEFLLSPNDYLAIKLGLGLCKLQLGPAEHLNEAIDILLSLKVHYSKQFPSLYYYLAETYYLLQYYEQAKTTIKDGLENIEEIELLTELNWPGSDKKMIEASDKAVLIADLESLYTECKAYHKSDAICYLLSCPNKLIFFSSPLFNGYVSVLCSKNCNFVYHRECWKHKLKTSHIKKPSMVLESDCGTSDCGGIMKEIIIYDEKLNVNTKIRSNTKNVPTDSKWWIQKYKEVPKAKNSTEKPVPDNKRDKTISLESFPKCEPAEENSILSSTEKNSQVNNESKLNPFTKEFIPSYNQNHPDFASSSQSNLTESVVSIGKTTQVSIHHDKLTLNPFTKEYIPVLNQNHLSNLQPHLTKAVSDDTKNDLISNYNNYFEQKAPLVTLGRQNLFNSIKLHTDEQENRNLQNSGPNNLIELLNPNASIFVPMADQKPLNDTEIMPINSIHSSDLISTDPNNRNNNASYHFDNLTTNVRNACEKQFKSSETVISTNLNSAGPNKSSADISVPIKDEKPICVVEKSNNSNSVFSDESQIVLPCQKSFTGPECIRKKIDVPKGFNSIVSENVENDCSNKRENLFNNMKKYCSNNTDNLFNLTFTSANCLKPSKLVKFLPATTNIPKESKFVVSDNLKYDCSNKRDNLFNRNFTSSVPIDVSKLLKNTEHVTQNSNTVDQINPNPNPFVPKSKNNSLKEVVYATSVNNLSNSTVENSEKSAEGSKITNFVLKHIGEAPKILTAQNVTFVTSHTQTVMHTKEKQVQTVKTEKLPPKIPQTKDKQIQTVVSGEINSLKTQVNSLRTQLFEAEEAYNELLQNYNGYVEFNKKKPSIDCETQTLNAACTDCKKGKELLDVKNAEIAALKLHVYELLNANKKLRLQNSDLQSTITRNQTNYEQAHVTLLKENENLKTFINSYQASLPNLDPNGKKIPLRLQNILTEQFHYISKTFMSYFSTYENKCKHMLWELQDLISLATYDSLPSKQEFEENFRVWTNSLTDCKRSEELVINFFYQLNQKFLQDNTDDAVVTPLPNLLQEPPNIMMRHFKSILAINRKLEQDMNKNFMTFYKSPNAPNASYTESPIIDFNSDFMDKYGACARSPTAPLPVGTSAKEPEDKTTPFADISNSTNTTPQQTVKPVAVEKCASKKMPVKKDEKEKSTLVGQDKLLQKIEQQFPLAPPATLVTALQTIRERHGGLTGRDFRSIVVEVKSIVKEISGTTKEKVKIPICPQTNEQPPWKQVSNGVKWNNENPDLNCTICFDLMQKKNSVSLRCQHMFHRECIKQWLQTDSICPICRMFAILDDEFPPLK